MEFSLQTTFQFSNGIPESVMAKYLWIRLDRLRHGTWASRTSSLQPTFVLDFLHDGKGLCFLFFLSHYLARPYDSEQTRWLDFLFFSHPKDSGVLLHLTTRLCSMIASWNGLILRESDWGAIKSIAWAGHGQKISFPFPEFVVRLNCAISGSQKGSGMALSSINTKIFHT